MALFGRKKKDEAVKEVSKTEVKAAPKKTAKKSAPAKAESKVVAVAGSNPVLSAHPNLVNIKGVILGPRITEKATMKADAENVYVFEIAKNATKGTVRQAVTAIYNVKPVKVGIVYNPDKKVFSRGRMGRSSGVKKAYVYLKKGDKIEIV